MNMNKTTKKGRKEKEREGKEGRGRKRRKGFVCMYVCVKNV